MPTILELFRGSNKDITPTILDLTPVQELFIGSTEVQRMVDWLVKD